MGELGLKRSFWTKILLKEKFEFYKDREKLAFAKLNSTWPKSIYV
jgi:hypothetical protein